jgi:hypothetical protein
LTDEEAFQALVAQGVTLQYVEMPSVSATIGYAELWPELGALYCCEVGDGSTGQQHVVEFDRMVFKGARMADLRKRGKLVGRVATFDDYQSKYDLAQVTEIGSSGMCLMTG